MLRSTFVSRALAGWLLSCVAACGGGPDPAGSGGSGGATTTTTGSGAGPLACSLKEAKFRGTLAGMEIDETFVVDGWSFGYPGYDNNVGFGDGVVYWGADYTAFRLPQGTPGGGQLYCAKEKVPGTLGDIVTAPSSDSKSCADPTGGTPTSGELEYCARADH